MTPDVNLLLAAARGDHPHHAQAHRWLTQAAADAANGDGTLVLQPMVLASVLRLVTSAKVFQQPTPIDQAVAWLDAVLALPASAWARRALNGPNCARCAWPNHWPAMTCPTPGWPPRCSSRANTWPPLTVTSAACWRGIN